MRKFIPFAIATLIILVAVTLGLTKALGAHPNWAAHIALVGVPLGLAVAWRALKFPKWPIFAGLAVLTLAAYGVASYGKMQFAASYAEDQFAGQLWYFGWIAALGWATAALAVLFRQTPE